jgi:hypothetical protein
MGRFLHGAGGYEPMRLGRTMTAFAFSHADAAAAQGNPFVETYNFYTSPQHQCCDICDEYEGNSPYSKSDIMHLPPVHPNCVLPGTVVSIPGKVLAATKAFYVGKCIKVTTANGLSLSVTLNHPILTDRGWVAAQFVTKADKVICALNAERMTQAVNPDNDNVPACIEEIFSSLEKASGMTTTTVPVSAEDFHSDARFFDGNVNVIYPDSALLGYAQPFVDQPLRQHVFRSANVPSLLLGRGGAFKFGFDGIGSASAGDVSGLGHSIPTFDRHLKIHDRLTFFEAANSNPGFRQAITDDITRDAEATGEFIDRFASEIAFDNVVDIETFDFSGHVYDLQVDPYHLYISNGIITHNCVCSISWNESDDQDGIIERLRHAIQDGLLHVRRSIGDIIGPLSRRFLDILFRGDV